ncbi:MAG: M48 family metallopeptidase [Deltaproteobacteria bacterium]|nr:M48 family metallopeptidase [Deltaproteobacteria bacterium]
MNSKKTVLSFSWVRSCVLLSVLVLSLGACAGSGGKSVYTSSSAQNSQSFPKTKLGNYKRNHFNLYAIKDEITIGTRFMEKQKKEFAKKGWEVDPKNQAALKKRIETIVMRLAKVSDLPDLPYEVTLFKKDDVANAFCLPGGKMGVFTGLFDPKKGLVDRNNDAQIAAILAHEMAHASMRHVTRRMTSYTGLGIVGTVLTAGVAGQLGQDWGYLANQVFYTGTSLFLPSYSRRHESEADRVGLFYMARAGYDPGAAIAVWEKASALAAQKGKNNTEFFDSHPASGERANLLRSYHADAVQIQKASLQNQAH